MEKTNEQPHFDDRKRFEQGLVRVTQDDLAST